MSFFVGDLAAPGLGFLSAEVGVSKSALGSLLRFLGLRFLFRFRLPCDDDDGVTACSATWDTLPLTSSSSSEDSDEDTFPAQKAMAASNFSRNSALL